MELISNQLRDFIQANTTNIPIEELRAKAYNDIGELQGPQGIQGEKGNAGAQGIQGIQGEKGNAGDKGEKGDKGDRGDDGLSLKILGSYATLADLQTARPDGSTLNGGFAYWLNCMESQGRKH